MLGTPYQTQADISGQPLDHPTNPASMEAGLRHGDMTPHTLVGGAQTTLSRQRPARARVVETAQVRPGDLEIKLIPRP